MRKIGRRPRPRPHRDPRRRRAVRRRGDRRSEGRDHRRGDARRDGGLSRRRGPGLRRGDQVHARTSSRSTARTRPGRRSRRPSSARRSSSTWATATAGRARTPTTPKYTTKDGFGLNATAGAGDYNNKYYGEPYVVQLDLAPNAVVILNHLCYASGNSEPGNAGADASPSPASAPTTTPPASSRPARRRSSPTATPAPRCYIRATLHDPPVGRGHVADDARTRTATWSASRPPGRPARPSTRTRTRRRPASTARWRSRPLGVTTDEVVSGGYGDTGADPTSLVVPGNAAVTTDGAGAVQRPRHHRATRPTTLPAGTRLRVVEQPTQPSAAGGTAGRGRRASTTRRSPASCSPATSPRRTAPPRSSASSTRAAAFSPNGDASRDAASIRGRFTESVAWTLTHPRRRRPRAVLRRPGPARRSASPGTARSAGDPVAGRHLQVSVSGDDAWGNGQARATRELDVDTAAPELAGLTPPRARPMVLAQRRRRPRHGQPDRHEPRAGVARGPCRRRRRRAGQELDRRQRQRRRRGHLERPDAARVRYAPDGTYTIKRRRRRTWPATPAPASSGPSRWSGRCGRSTTSRSLFFPQDLDALDMTTTLSFTLPAR